MTEEKSWRVQSKRRRTRRLSQTKSAPGKHSVNQHQDRGWLCPTRVSPRDWCGWGGAAAGAADGPATPPGHPAALDQRRPYQ